MNSIKHGDERFITIYTDNGRTARHKRVKYCVRCSKWIEPFSIGGDDAWQRLHGEHYVSDEPVRIRKAA